MLSANFEDPVHKQHEHDSDHMLHIEFHLRRVLDATGDQDEDLLDLHEPWNARVAHLRRMATIQNVVIRMNDITTTLNHLTDAWTSVAAVDKAMSKLPNLRTLILETSDDTRTSDEFAAKLTSLHAGGRVHQRTYADAQRLAQEAHERDDRAGASKSMRATSWEDPDLDPDAVVSPYWYRKEPPLVEYSDVVLRNVETMLVSDVF